MSEQHLLALKKANSIRLARAKLKHDVAAGEVLASTVLMEGPWEAESMTVAELLMSQTRWGRTRTRRVLLAADLPELKTIGSLTDRQRMLLAGILEKKGC